jgi:hypothetical protein
MNGNWIAGIGIAAGAAVLIAFSSSLPVASAKTVCTQNR